MMNLIQLLTDQQAYEGITHSWWGASWNWRWRRVDDDEDWRFPSPKPQTGSRSALPMKNRRWRRLRIIKRDETFSLIFSPWKWIYGVRVEVGGGLGGPQVCRAHPHPCGYDVGPLVLILSPIFLLISKIISVDFQVIPRTFYSAHK